MHSPAPPELRAPDSDLARRRHVLAEARRATQVKMLPLAGVALLLSRPALRLHPLLALGTALAVGFVVVRAVVRYRRLKEDLGLAAEYDELDENASWGGKTLLILLGLFGSLFALVYFLALASKH